MWGAYALVVYALILRAGPFYVSGYGLGAIALYYSDHIAPKLEELNWKRIGWFALLLYGGGFLIGCIFGVAQPHISEMQKAQLLEGVSEETWGIVASTVAMRLVRVWSLETLIAVWASGLLLTPLDLLIGVPIVQTQAAILSGVFWTLLGWAFSRALPTPRGNPDDDRMTSLDISLMATELLLILHIYAYMVDTLVALPPRSFIFTSLGGSAVAASSMALWGVRRGIAELDLKDQSLIFPVLGIFLNGAVMLWLILLWVMGEENLTMEFFKELVASFS